MQHEMFLVSDEHGAVIYTDTYTHTVISIPEKGKKLDSRAREGGTLSAAWI